VAEGRSAAGLHEGDGAWGREQGSGCAGSDCSDHAFPVRISDHSCGISNLWVNGTEIGVPADDPHPPVQGFLAQARAFGGWVISRRMVQVAIVWAIVVAFWAAVR